MRKALSILLAAMLILTVCPALSEGQQAPDFLLEGYDGDGGNRVWENNLFFQRMQERTGVSFQFRQYSDWDQWAARKQTLIQGEDLPDVLFKAELNATEIREMAENGVLLDLKPYLAEYAPDLWALLEANPEDLAAITMPDGSIRALPSINELPNNDLMWINTDWLKNLHLEPPKTAEEMTEVLRAFKNGDPNRNGRADEVPLTFIGMWELRFLGHAFGITDNDYYLSVKDGRAVPSLTSEENRAFLTWLHQLWQEELLDHKGFINMDTLRQVTDEKAAMTYGMMLSIRPETVVPSAALSQYGVLEPLAYEGKQVYRNLLGRVTRGTFAITRECKAPEKLISWVNYLYTHEGSVLMQAGLEGEEYFWNEDGRWEWMADLQTVGNEVLPNATLSGGGTAPGIVEMDFQRQHADTGIQRLIEQMSQVVRYAVTPFPLVNLSREDAERAARLQADIAPFAEQTMAEFVTGDREINDENWAAFAEGLEARGFSEMIALWQQYVR